MHLTLESLNEVKETCAEIQSLEGLMDAESRLVANEYLSGLKNAADHAIQNLNALSQMRGSLEACGYSEDWFDNVCGMGFKDLIQIDMPKFFDNKVNREQVCMEGFVDTIKAWAERAWQVIKKILGWIRDAAAKLVQWFHAENLKNKQGISKAFPIIEKYIDDFIAKNRKPIVIKGWFEIQGLEAQINAIRTLIEVVSEKYFMFDGLTSAEPGKNIDEDMKKDFVQKTIQSLNLKNIAPDKPEETGFSVRIDPNSNSVVQFVGVQIRKDFTPTDFEIGSAQTVTELRDLFENKITKLFDDTMIYLKGSDKMVKTYIIEGERKIREFKTAAVVDTVNVNFWRKAMIQGNLASAVVTGALMFMNRMCPMVVKDRDLIIKLAEELEKQKPQNP